MYRIAICDDEATSLALNSSLTKKILEEEKIDYVIDTFSNMNDMIQCVTNAVTPYDILLSDILTTEMNGIDAAAKLRYLQKPYEPETLREALLSAYKQLRKKEGLHLTSGDKTYRLSYADILYMESDSRDVHFHMKKGNMITIRIKLADLEKMLPEGVFCRCHRSYIINMQHVIRVERYQATLENQKIVPISQMQYNETKRMFMATQL